MIGNGAVETHEAHAHEERAGGVDPFSRLKEQTPRGLDAIMADEEEQGRYRAMLGPLFEPLADRKTTALRVNADGKIVHVRYGEKKRVLPETMSERQRQALLGYIANFEFGRAIDRLHSRLRCDLPIFGTRVQAFAPPISGWTMILRNHLVTPVQFGSYFDGKPHTRPSSTWADYPNRVRIGWAEAILEAISLRMTLGVGGGTDSGKTTFLESVLAEHARIYPDERMVIIQDNHEIKAPGFFDKIELIARVEQAHHETNGTVSRYMYDFADAIEDGMRCDCESCVWGEVRDALSALGLVMMLNTGTRGCKFTIHCDSARDLPQRLEDFHSLIGRKPVKRMIAKAGQLIIYCERDNNSGTRRIVDVARVLEVKDDEYVFEHVQPKGLMPEDGSIAR